jgi:hypothetical protein
MIKNLQDLAHHVSAARDASTGATDEETAKSIARRLYKDTECGISCHVFEGKVDHKPVVYSVRCALSDVGWEVLGWRTGGKTNLGTVPLPAGLADYLLTDDAAPGKFPVLCKRDHEGILFEFRRAWMDNEVEPDVQLTRKTKWGDGVILTIQVDEPVFGKMVGVTGYAEGADAECHTHELAFPFTDEAFDAAVKHADEEGCELWEVWNSDQTDEDEIPYEA